MTKLSDKDILASLCSLPKNLPSDHLHLIAQGKIPEDLYVPSNLAVLLQGRSRFARKGITVELSSSRFDPGWCGTMVMEIANVGSTNFNLFPNLPICAITFEALSSPASIPYFAKQDAAFRGQQ